MPSEANQRLTKVILNLIVIQLQSFDVSVMYSHSLRVPLAAGPLRSGPFFVQALGWTPCQSPQGWAVCSD